MIPVVGQGLGPGSGKYLELQAAPIIVAVDSKGADHQLDFPPSCTLQQRLHLRSTIPIYALAALDVTAELLRPACPVQHWGLTYTSTTCSLLASSNATVWHLLLTTLFRI